jgi:hypothetical protein
MNEKDNTNELIRFDFGKLRIELRKPAVIWRVTFVLLN